MTYGSTLALARNEPILADETGDIVSAVENALAQAGELDSRHIVVTAKGSDIKLDGWVLTRAEVSRSAEIAARVKGVHAVRNEVRIRFNPAVEADIRISVSYNRRLFARFTGMTYQLERS